MNSQRISPDDVDTGPGRGIPVISKSQKFVIPVPQAADEADPLVYPPGHPQAGQPIVDYEGKRIGERGIVFFNAKDNAWQAAAADGQSVIILNEVTTEQADALLGKWRDLQSGPDPLSLSQIKQLLTFAHDELGLADVYNSTRSYVQDKLTPISPATGQIGAGLMGGLMRRKADDVLRAVYIEGDFVFEGPTVSPQHFRGGGIILEQADGKRGIQPDVFLRTYTHPDGRRIESVAELQTQVR